MMATFAFNKLMYAESLRGVRKNQRRYCNTVHKCTKEFFFRILLQVLLTSNICGILENHSNLRGVKECLKWFS